MPGRAALEGTFHEREHPLLQELAAARETLFCRRLGEVELAGHLGERTLLPVVQHQRLPVRLGNGFQRLPQQGLFLILHHGALRGFVAGFERPDIGEAVGSTERLPGFRASVALDLVAQDAAQPGLELVRLTQAAEPLPRLDEGLLSHVLAFRQVAERGVGERAQQALVALDDPAERAPVALQGRGDQGLVARLLLAMSFSDSHGCT